MSGGRPASRRSASRQWCSPSRQSARQPSACSTSCSRFSSNSCSIGASDSPHSMAKQDPNAGRNWYVVHTYAGYEDSVKQSLLQRVESFGMQDYILDVQVPKEKQLVFKKGEPVEEERKLFPGY